MSRPNDPYIFKGDQFINRYRIDVILTSKSPLHIGSGATRPEPLPSGKIDPETGKPRIVEIDEIIRDNRGYPYVSGSSLRGAIRHYLLHILQPFGPDLAKIEDFTDARFRDMKAADKIGYMQNEACLLDQLFGTPFCESKIEFWDAMLENPVLDNTYQQRGWDSLRQSYVIQSVAIDPQTGAAASNKLYSFEVAPPGLHYRLSVVGQNLSTLEAGLLLIGLNAFNSSIIPLTIGAMAARGYGQCSITSLKIYQLLADNMPAWVRKAQSSGKSGFDLLEEFELSSEAHATLMHDAQEEVNAILEDI